MKVEFFHDVICSFCFPMSDRMREINNEIPELEIVHRSFALGWDGEDFEMMFGSRAEVKPEVLTHWAHANENDAKHRFNIEGMRNEDFDFPTSKNGLLAAKAAGMIGDQSTYWEVFDKLQEGLFMRSMNIESIEVIEQLIQETSVDFNAWKRSFLSDEVFHAVQEDFDLASNYGLRGVPALIIDSKYLVSGAQPKEEIVKIIRKIIDEKKEKPMIVEVSNQRDNFGDACSFNDGKWECN